MVQRLSLMVPNFVVNLIQHRFFVLLCFVWIIVLKISPPLFKWLALPEKSQKERLSSQLVWIFHSFVFQSDAADTSNIKPDFSRYESSGRLRKILMLTKLLLFLIGGQVQLYSNGNVRIITFKYVIVSLKMAFLWNSRWKTLQSVWYDSVAFHL